MSKALRLTRISLKDKRVFLLKSHDCPTPAHDRALHMSTMCVGKLSRIMLNGIGDKNVLPYADS